MKELQLKLLTALFSDIETSLDETSGEWFLIPDYILRIPEKYRDSTHPCYVHNESKLAAYGLVKVYIRSTTTSDAVPPEYIHHERHLHGAGCPLSKDGIVSVVRPARIGAANFRQLAPKCTESDLEWQHFLYACIKKVS
jgi:hypothetical protein